MIVVIALTIITIIIIALLEGYKLEKVTLKYTSEKQILTFRVHTTSAFGSEALFPNLFKAKVVPEWNNYFR